MNHESEWLTGWTLPDALHRPLPEVFRIVNEETRAVVENPVAKVLVDKKTIGLANHTVLISRNGDEWPIEDSAAPILSATGEILGVVLVFHDATSSRLAQKSLKASNEELEKTVAERTLTLQQTVSELQAFPTPSRTTCARRCARCRLRRGCPRGLRRQAGRQRQRLSRAHQGRRGAS